MRKLLIFIFLISFSATISGQPFFDAGLKAGVNNSKVTVNLKEFTTESIVKSHVGAFARLGWNRIYLQPEAYFSSKGGELRNPSVLDMMTKFDFNNVDVPILFGVKLVEGENANIRLMTGPVFSFLTSNKIYGDDLLSSDYYKNSYYGYQFGIGIDLWSFFLDTRMEYGANRLYHQPDLGLDGKNKTFMVTLGYKIF